MKTLKQILELYKPKSQDEDKFVRKHIVVKHKDRNGNGDPLFQATNIKAVDRKSERHGYEPGQDEEVYEQAKWRKDPKAHTIQTDDSGMDRKVPKGTNIDDDSLEGGKDPLKHRSMTPYPTPNRQHPSGPGAKINYKSTERLKKQIRDRKPTPKPNLPEEYEALDESYDEMKSHYNKWANAHAGDGGTPDVKAAAKHKQNIISKYGPETFRHFQKALRANINQKFDKEEAHLDDAFQNAESVREEVDHEAERDRAKADMERHDKAMNKLESQHGTKAAAKHPEFKKHMDAYNDAMDKFNMHHNALRNMGEETDLDEGKFRKSLNAIRTGGGPVGALLRNRAAKELTKSRNMPAGNDRKSAEAGAKQFTKAAIAHSAAPRRPRKELPEEVEYIEEKLKVSDGIGAWISDFVHSENPKFEGFSKRKRMKMAQAAFYSAQRGD